mgnify:CR=1 FL=1
MTPKTIKQHLEKAEEILKGQKKNLFYIREQYHTKLCNEAKNYLNNETKTRTYHNFLKKIGFSNKEIKLDALIYEHCKNTHVYYQETVTSAFVPAFLNISKYEYQKLLKKEFLIPSGYEEVKLYGRYVNIPFFNIHMLMDYFLKNINNEELLISRLKLKFPNFNIDLIKETISFSHFITPLIYIEFIQSFKKGKDISKLTCSIEKAVSNIQTKIDELISLNLKNKIEAIILSGDKIYIDNDQNILTNKNHDLGSYLNFEKINKISFSQAKSILDIQTSIPSFEYEDLLKLYPAMNNIKREFKFILGPTNSGKTHNALIHLKEAKSGIYLGPLRMLAQEKYEELLKDGISTSLLTGEKKIIDISATHVSATVESVDPDKKYDVGIIDEIQMLDDMERGRYWLKAILSLNADTIYLLGSEHFHYIQLIKNIFDKYNIKYEIEIKERLSNLLPLNKTIQKEDLQKGDVIIAFDKNTLFLLAEDLQYNNKKISVLFGELPYERKIEELENFKYGKTDILISTDAISMGINLPIKRILFHKLYKYNGYFNEQINSSLFNQIIGRAGRYYEDGFYGLYHSQFVSNKLHPDDLLFLNNNNNIFDSLKNCYINNKTIKKVKIEKNNFDYLYLYDNYLLNKLSLSKLNYLQVLKKYNELNPFNCTNNIPDSSLIQDIIKNSNKEGLYFILSLSPFDKLFKYSDIKSYISNFDFNHSSLFVDEKITRILKLKLLNSKINNILANQNIYELPWSNYSKDLSFKIRDYDYPDYFYRY